MITTAHSHTKKILLLTSKCGYTPQNFPAIIPEKQMHDNNTGGKSDLIGGNYEYMQGEVFLSVHGSISIPHRGPFSKHRALAVK